MNRYTPHHWLVLAALAALCGCGDDEAAEPLPPPVMAEPLFAADFLQTFQEVRNCRPSSEHDLGRVRVYADPQALGPYTTREGAFEEGATLVKEEYDGTDPECEGPVTMWTVMQRLADGASPATLGWRWQRVSATREVMTEDDPRCAGCHTSCNAPEGFSNTCAVP